MKRFLVVALIASLPYAAVAQVPGGGEPGVPSGGGAGVPVNPSAAVSIPNLTLNGGFPRWNACMGRLRTGNGNCKLLAVGDSQNAGFSSAWQGTAWARAQSWPTELASILPLIYNVPASANAVFGSAGITTEAEYLAYDTRSATHSWTPLTSVFSLGGPIWLGGPGFQFIFDPANVAQFPQANLISTDTFVYFLFNYAGGYVSTISVNGGAALATDTDSTTTFVQRQVTTTLGVNNWQINCTVLGLAGCGFIGFYAYNSTVPQVLVLNAGWGGAGASAWNISGGQSSDPLLAIQVVAPDLCVIEVGAADAAAGLAIPAYIAFYTNIINACKASGDVLMVSSKPLAPTAVTYTDQNTYIQANRTIATSANVAIYDWFAALCGFSAGSCPKGGWSAGGQAGWMSGNFNSASDHHGGAPHQTTLATMVAAILMNN